MPHCLLSDRPLVQLPVATSLHEVRAYYLTDPAYYLTDLWFNSQWRPVCMRSGSLACMLWDWFSDRQNRKLDSDLYNLWPLVALQVQSGWMPVLAYRALAGVSLSLLPVWPRKGRGLSKYLSSHSLPLHRTAVPSQRTHTHTAWL